MAGRILLKKIDYNSNITTPEMYEFIHAIIFKELENPNNCHRLFDVAQHMGDSEVMIICMEEMINDAHIENFAAVAKKFCDYAPLFHETDCGQKIIDFAKKNKYLIHSFKHLPNELKNMI